MKDRIFISKLCAWIPGNVNNRLLLEILELMQAGGQIFCPSSLESFQKNSIVFSSHQTSIRQAGGYIEDQNSYGDMTFGRSTMKLAGCEVIAVYNALSALKALPAESLPGLIRIFEKQGMVLAGKFGTSPKSILRYFRKTGRQAEWCTKPSEFDCFGNRYSVLILTMYNNRSTLLDQIHTIYIGRDHSGFTAHNVYGNGRVIGPFSSLTELMGSINRGKAEGICLIGVN